MATVRPLAPGPHVSQRETTAPGIAPRVRAPKTGFARLSRANLFARFDARRARRREWLGPALAPEVPSRLRAFEPPLAVPSVSFASSLVRRRAVPRPDAGRLFAAPLLRRRGLARRRSFGRRRGLPGARRGRSALRGGRARRGGRPASGRSRRRRTTSRVALRRDRHVVHLPCSAVRLLRLLCCGCASHRCSPFALRTRAVDPSLDRVRPQRPKSVHDARQRSARCARSDGACPTRTAAPPRPAAAGGCLAPASHAPPRPAHVCAWSALAVRVRA
jgi:hypothetical protein